MSGPVKYSIVPVTEDDKDRVIEFLYRNFFQDEPLSEYLEIVTSPDDKSPAYEEFSISSIPQGLSLMAVDSEGKILGLRLSELLTRKEHSKKTPQSVEKINKCQDPKIKKVLEILDKVYWDKNVFDLYPKVDKVLGFKMLSVDNAYRNQGIAKALLEKSIELAKEKGISVIRVDCSSLYSSRAMSSLGFILVNTLPYQDYVDSSGHPIFTPKPPHVAINTFVKTVA